MNYFIFLLPLSFVLIHSCDSGSDTGNSGGTSPQSTSDSVAADPGHNSRNALDWPGTYTGTPPRPEGPGTVTTLRLYDTQQFTLSLESPGPQGETVEVGGYFDWRPDGGSIQLLGFDPEKAPTYYLIGENQLFQLSLEGKREETLDPASRLTRVSTPLTVTEWTLESIEGRTLPGGSQDSPTLALSADGSASGMAGCNTFRGTYEENQNRLLFSPLVSTKMACPALATQQAYLAALATVVTYRLGEGRLVLLNEASDVVLQFIPPGS